MACRPAFGGAVFRAGAEGDNRAGGVEAVGGEGGLAGCRVDGEARVVGMAVKIGLRGVGEGGVAVHHQRQGGFVEFADVVEQKIARFAHIAGALADACCQRDDGGFERAGQHDHLVVAASAQFVPDAPAFFQFECTVAEGVFDDFANFGHTGEHGHRPFGREHVDGAAGVEFVQAAVERLGHDAVADPAWGNDEDFFGHSD